MFTGIVEEVGRVTEVDTHPTHAHVRFACATVVEAVGIGDSINVDGCCLTVTSLPGDGFTADLMAQTREITALGQLEVGQHVNLERAARLDSRLGGHLVQGHVDGVGEVVARKQEPGTVWLSIRVPTDLVAYLVPRGSVTICGVSLTVAELDDDVVTVGLIPHTVEMTTFSQLDVGIRVNLEVDVIAKYVERLLAAGQHTPYLQER